MDKLIELAQDNWVVASVAGVTLGVLLKGNLEKLLDKSSAPDKKKKIDFNQAWKLSDDRVARVRQMYEMQLALQELILRNKLYGSSEQTVKIEELDEIGEKLSSIIEEM